MVVGSFYLIQIINQKIGGNGAHNLIEAFL